MAVFDLLSAVVVSRYSNAQYNNIVYGQVISETNALTQLTDFGALVLDKFVEPAAKASVDSYQYDAIIVRRLKPSITDVEVVDIAKSGDLPQSGLSGTCYTLLRYFCDPYEAGSSYHWKLTGLPMDANKRGLMTEQAVVRYTEFIEAMTLGPYVEGGSTFDFIRGPKNTDAAATLLPTIYKAQVDNTIRNLRSRQLRL